MNWRTLSVLVLVLVLGGYLWLHPAHPPPGIGAPETPLQTSFDSGDASGTWPVAEGYQAAALASYQIHARVLSKARYRYDRCAPIAPVDLALGWGRMSDWAVYSELNIVQRGRFYGYSWGAEGPPIPREEIIVSSANTHIIPADATVSRALAAVRAHDLVWMEGVLVEVRGPDGFVWRSSLTRNDTGNGACELFRVTKLVIESPDSKPVTATALP